MPFSKQKEEKIRTIYWENGRVKWRIHFQNGLSSRMDQMWNEEGVLVDEGKYENGKPVGVHRRWNAKGFLIEEITYRDTRRFNLRSWDNEGVLRVEAIWIDDSHYVEKAWDRFQNIWVEKKGVWDGKEIQFTLKSQNALLEGEEIGKLEEGDPFAIFMEQFPKLALLAPQWERKETCFEKLDCVSIGELDAIYVYGLGNGAPYFQLKAWLHGSASRKLIFLEDEEGHISHFLQEKKSISLFQDPQVYLELIEKGQKDFTNMCRPIKDLEDIAFPEKYWDDIDKWDEKNRK